MTEEKIRCLLLIYKNKNLTVTSLARKINMSKATISRILHFFYQENLIVEKGKCILNKNGSELAKQYNQQIERLAYWIKQTSHLQDKDAKLEAIKLVISLNPETIQKICSRIHMDEIFNKLDHLVEFSGQYLENNLEDGHYDFSFSIFKDQDHNQFSMAHQAFKHPAFLLIKEGRGYLVFEPIEIKKPLLKEKIVITSKLKQMQYLIDRQYYDCLENDHQIFIPITHLNFFYTKEERLIQTSFTIKVQAQVSKYHMPESVASLKILFH